ncbi:unnamed protein product [Diamesa serratosioi]
MGYLGHYNHQSVAVEAKQGIITEIYVWQPKNSDYKDKVKNFSRDGGGVSVSDEISYIICRFVCVCLACLACPGSR